LREFIKLHPGWSSPRRNRPCRNSNVFLDRDKKTPSSREPFQALPDGRKRLSGPSAPKRARRAGQKNFSFSFSNGDERSVGERSKREKRREKRREDFLESREETERGDAPAKLEGQKRKRYERDEDE
jgi:hypothetical protein